MAKGMHFDQRRHPDGIAKVIGIDAFGQTGTGHWLGSEEAGFQPLFASFTDEGENQARHIAASTCAANYHVRVIVRQCHLLESLFANNSLVQQYVVEHAAQRILGCSTAGGGNLYRFTDGDAKAALVIRVFCQDAAARVGEIAGAGVDSGAVGFHHIAAIRLLLIADFDHEDFDFYAEVGASQRQSRSPLPGARLG